MTTITLSWNEFLKEAEEFQELSMKLNDNWELIRKNENDGNSFLSCKKKVQSKIFNKSGDPLEELSNLFDQSTEDTDCAVIAHNNIETEVLLIEYHIVYNIAYQVPVLYLKVQRSDGSMLGMEQIWHIFGINEEDTNLKSRKDMLTVLTQLDHPVIFKPFYAIHPCRTAELLGQTPKSRNRVLTFISLMGPYLKLYLDNRYGYDLRKTFEVKEN